MLTVPGEGSWDCLETGSRCHSQPQASCSVRAVYSLHGAEVGSGGVPLREAAGGAGCHCQAGSMYCWAGVPGCEGGGELVGKGTPVIAGAAVSGMLAGRLCWWDPGRTSASAGTQADPAETGCVCAVPSRSFPLC